MEPNKQPEPQPTQNEIVSTSVAKSTKNKAPKPLIATLVILVILTIVASSFAVYLYLDADRKNAEISNLQNTISSLEASKDTTDENTNAGESNTQPIEEDNPPLTSEGVAKLLEEKYRLSSTKNMVLFSGMYSYINNLDIISKIKFAYQMLEQDGLCKNNYQESDEEGLVMCQLEYDTLNNKIKYYFGNDENLEKKDYNLDSYEIVKMVYNSETNKFQIHIRDGLGGYSPTMKYIKVGKVGGNENNFYAIASSVTIQESGYELNKDNTFYTGDNQNEGEFSLPKEELDSIYDSLTSYKFNFITEDGQYKLTSVDKL